MIEAGLRGVEFIAVNTDAQALLMSDADVKLDIGRDLTRGLGAGADPDKGRQAAEDHAQDIEDALRGGHGVRHRRRGRRYGNWRRARRRPSRPCAGCAHHRRGNPAVLLRSRRRSTQAEQGIATLREEVDTLIVIPNDKLLQMIDHQIAILDAFKQADQVLMQGVSGITDLITTPGLINLDFADVKAVMSNAGSASDGHRLGARRGPGPGCCRDGGLIAPARGQHRWSSRCPAFHRRRLGPWPFRGLGSGQPDPGAAHEDANIIFGTVIDDALGDEVRVTVIAAGFEGGQPPRRSPESADRLT